MNPYRQYTKLDDSWVKLPSIVYADTPWWKAMMCRVFGHKYCPWNNRMGHEIMSRMCVRCERSEWRRKG